MRFDSSGPASKMLNNSRRRRARLVPGATALALLLVVVAASGCASARVQQFDQFAQAGVAFTQAIPPVLDDAFAAAVTTDSLLLTENRADLPEPADRLAAINSSDELLRQRLAIYNNLKSHALLLQNYFNVLQTLASTDADASGLTDVANGLVEQMGTLSPAIQGATIGNASVADLVSPVINLVFTTFQAGALNRELERNAPTIEREIDLQRAALQAIARSMRSDLEATFTAQDRDTIIEPFIGSGNLPAGWQAARLAALRRRVQTTSVDEALEAAENLRLGFVALVENRPTANAIAGVLQSVNEILVLIGESQ